MVFVKRCTIVISFRGIWSRVVSPIRCTVYVSPFYFRVSLQSKETNAFAGNENLRSSAVTVVTRIFPLSFSFLSRAIVSWILIERFIVHAKHLQLSRWQIGLNTKTHWDMTVLSHLFHLMSFTNEFPFSGFFGLLSLAHFSFVFLSLYFHVCLIRWFDLKVTTHRFMRTKLSSATFRLLLN